MKLIAGMGTGVSLDAEASQSCELKLMEEHRRAVHNQIDAFLDAV